MMAANWLSMVDRFWLSPAGKTLSVLRVSRNFRESAGNAVYSAAEYVAQPLSMLLAAPFLVHKLGLQQYGIWMLVSAILGSMGILSTGFGDATVKYVSAYRGQNNPAGVERTIRATLTINAFLGGLFGLLVWAAAHVRGSAGVAWRYGIANLARRRHFCRRHARPRAGGSRRPYRPLSRARIVGRGRIFLQSAVGSC